MDKRYLRAGYGGIVIIYLLKKSLMQKRIMVSVNCVDMLNILFRMTTVDRAITDVNKYVFFLLTSIFIIVEIADYTEFWQKNIGAIYRIRLKYMHRVCIKMVTYCFRTGAAYYMISLAGVAVCTVIIGGEENIISQISENAFIFLYPLMYMCMLSLMSMVMCRVFTMKVGVLIMLMDVCLSIFIEGIVFLGNYCFYSRYRHGMIQEGMVLIIIFVILTFIVELMRRKWFDGGIDSYLQENW